jgi:hypothetical protein
MNTITGQKTKWQLVAQGDYASVANYRTRPLVMFRGLFVTFRSISKILII